MTQAPVLAPALLSVSEALLAIEATPDRCALLDAHGRIERTNLPWERSTRRADPVALLTSREGDDFVAACGRAALHGNRDAGCLHAQVRAVLEGTVERSELTFTRPAEGGGVVECRVTIERLVGEGTHAVLIAFSAPASQEARWTSVPEAGFSVPAGAPISQLAHALEAMPSHAAILDPRGRVTAVNAAWRLFAATHGATQESTGVGVNYLSICAKAAESGDERADAFLMGLMQVLRGDRESHVADAHVGLGAEARPFRGRVTSMDLAEGRFALVTHTDLRHRSEAAGAASPARAAA